MGCPEASFSKPSQQARLAVAVAKLQHMSDLKTRFAAVATVRIEAYVWN